MHYSIQTHIYRFMLITYYRPGRTLKLTGRPCTGAQSVNTENAPEPEITDKFHADPVKRFITVLIFVLSRGCFYRSLLALTVFSF
jgi:hypothetical protein